MTQTITLISPPDITQLRKHEPVIVSVTDTDGLGAVSVWTKFESLRDWDAVYLDAELSPRYEDAGSVVTETVAGVTKVFTLRRRDGWPSNEQTDVALPVRIYFNEAVVTNHATTHELDGTDQIAGQKLRITTTFTPVWTAAVDSTSAPSTSMLGAILKGISTYLAGLASSISSNTSSISTNTSSIATLSSTVSGHTTSIAAKADLDLTTVVYSGAGPHTGLTSDARKMIEVSHSSAVTYTFAAGLPVGSVTSIMQTGAGQLTCAGPGGGVTFTYPTSLTAKSRATKCPMSLYVRSSSEYVLSGDVAAT